MFNSVGEHYNTRQIVLDAYSHRPLPLNNNLFMWIAFAVALVVGLASALISVESQEAINDQNRRENQKNRDFNATQAEISRNWEEQMYKENSSPAAQVQQRLAAGLNPFDQISSQKVGSSSTASAPSILSMLNPFPPDMGDSLASQISDAPSKSMDFKLKKEDIETADKNQALTDAETEKTINEALQIAIQNKNLPESIKLQQELLKGDIKFKNASAQKLEQEARRIVMDNEAFKEARDAGVNQYLDEHYNVRQLIDTSKAQMASFKSSKEYQDMQTKVLGRTEARANALFPYDKENAILENRIKKNIQKMGASDAELKSVENYYELLYYQVLDGTLDPDDAQGLFLHMIKDLQVGDLPFPIPKFIP